VSESGCEPTEPLLRAWQLEYAAFDPQTERAREVICSQGNGYLACRASVLEPGERPFHYPGTYRAGLYDRLTTRVDEKTIPHESLVRLPSWISLELRLDEGPFLRLADVELLQFWQSLDLRAGIFSRCIRLRDRAGHVVRVLDRRFASMAEPHLAALQVELTVENWSGPVELRYSVELTPLNRNAAEYEQLRGDHLRDIALSGLVNDTGEFTLVQAATRQSRVKVAMAVRTRARPGRDDLVAPTDSAKALGTPRKSRCRMQANEALRIEKVCALYTSRDLAISEPGEAALAAANAAGSFEELLAPHKLAWAQLWQRFAFEVAGHEALTGGLRLCLFHILQTVTVHSSEADAGAPARGWSGEGYHGHVFWDELFLMPILTLRAPALARGLLMYRVRRLPAARRAAAELGYRGAMFPWRSASDGREVTDPYRENPLTGKFVRDDSSLQRHIGSAIAYNVWQYYQVTHDTDFLSDYGAELILEVARFWASVAQFNPATSRYEIRGVVGPDEFHDHSPEHATPGIDNNAYTNVFAAWVLATSERALAALSSTRRDELLRALDLGDRELEEMRHVSRALYVPFVQADVIEQFEGYAQLKPFDLEAHRELHPDLRRLDNLLDAAGDDVNRYQVSKQTDVLMLFYLFCNEELCALFQQLGYSVSTDLMRKNFEYYRSRTVHGSTLSRVVDAWVSSRLERASSLDTAKRALFTDLCHFNASSSTAEGIHLGAMAGAVDIFQRCYLGMSAREDALWFEPNLPRELETISMNMRYRGTGLRVVASQDALELSADPDAPDCVVYVGQQRVKLSAGETHRIAIEPSPTSS
jgi:trehalose/maltose hydrolase-like predicted phosphorylase